MSDVEAKIKQIFEEIEPEIEAETYLTIVYPLKQQVQAVVKAELAKAKTKQELASKRLQRLINQFNNEILALKIKLEELKELCEKRPKCIYDNPMETDPEMYEWWNWATEIQVKVEELVEEASS